MKLTKCLVFLLCIGLVVTFVGETRAEGSPERGELVPVRFYAWAGSAEVNAYIQWAKRELAEHHGIELQHVKVADISEAVTLLLAPGAKDAGAIDLLWINGENFATLKQSGKLLGELPDKVANSRLLREDLHWQVDFGTPVDGFELPWGIAQLQLIMRSNRLMPQQKVLSPTTLLSLAQQYPERFSYPKPPSFHGTSWLKALAFQLSQTPQALIAPAQEETKAAVLAPLWDYLDRLHPFLWQGGDEFPVSAGRQRQLFNQGVLDNSITFNPNEVKALQVQGKLSNDARSVSLGERALTNFHYLAIPVTSERQAAAIKVINFFLSPAAQRQKADPRGWGDPSVIQRVTTDAVTDPLVSSHPEPHVSWNEILEREWLARYQR